MLCTATITPIGFVQESPLKKLIFWVCVLFGAPGLAVAQISPTPTIPSQANPADPSAAATLVVYQSVFADTPNGVETQSIDWKKANAEVGQFKRGHVDVLKWEESQSAKQGNYQPQGKP